MQGTATAYRAEVGYQNKLGRGTLSSNSTSTQGWVSDFTGEDVAVAHWVAKKLTAVSQVRPAHGKHCLRSPGETC